MLSGADLPEYARDELRHMLVAVLAPAVLAGPESSGDLIDTWPAEPAEWPNGYQDDAALARRLCGVLEFNRVDWLWAVENARGLTRNRRYCRLLITIADQLERRSA